MIIDNKLIEIQKRASEIEAQMNSGNVSGAELTRLSKEYSRVSEMLPLISEYFQTRAGIRDAEEMLAIPEMKDMANEQLYNFKELLPEIEKKIQIALLPVDEADDHSIIMEIRAGIGGDEAGIVRR